VLTLPSVNTNNVGQYSLAATNPLGGTVSPAALVSLIDVAAWGGTFGQGSQDVIPYPPLPANLTNIIAVAAGAGNGMALRSNGTVFVWGDNSSGQTNVPAAASNVVAIACGSSHCLVLRADGTVVGWVTMSTARQPRHPH